MSGVLVDSNVLIDVAEDDPVWGAWSRGALERLAKELCVVFDKAGEHIDPETGEIFQ